MTPINAKPWAAEEALSHLRTRLQAVGVADRLEVDAWTENGYDDLPWIGRADDVIWLDQLTSRDPRRGVGRAGMAELCMLADEHDCRIALNPWAQDHPGALRQDQIERFYQSLGFGWRRDHVMMREPWTETTVHVLRDVKYQPSPNRSEFILSNTQPGSRLTRTSFVFPVMEDGSVLMATSRKEDRDVEVPGGHIEPGETQEQAGSREGMEETGARTGPLIAIGHQRMLSSGEEPAGWRYPFPLAYQSFFAAKVTSIDPYVENDECGPPVAIRDFSLLKQHERLFAIRAVEAVRRAA